MKIRISNKWNKETKSFEKALYDIKESDKTISGRFSLSAKKNDKWSSMHMAFIAFKNDIDLETKNALLHHGGKLIEVFGDLTVDVGYDDKPYFKFVIKKANLVEKKEVVQHFQETSEEDSSIPF